MSVSASLLYYLTCYVRLERKRRTGHASWWISQVLTYYFFLCFSLLMCYFAATLLIKTFIYCLPVKKKKERKIKLKPFLTPTPFIYQNWRQVYTTYTHTQVHVHKHLLVDWLLAAPIYPITLSFDCWEAQTRFDL